MDAEGRPLARPDQSRRPPSGLARFSLQLVRPSRLIADEAYEHFVPPQGQTSSSQPWKSDPLAPIWAREQSCRCSGPAEPH